MGEVAGGGETARSNPGEVHPGVVAPGYEWYAQAATGSLLPLFSFRSSQMESGLPRASAEIKPKLTETALAVAGEATASAELPVLLTTAVSGDSEITASASLPVKVAVSAPRKIKEGDYTWLFKNFDGWTEGDEKTSNWTEESAVSGSWSET